MEDITLTSPRPDRFIPSRSALDLEYGRHHLMRDSCLFSEGTDSMMSPNSHASYTSAMAEGLFSVRGGDSTKILAFNKKAPTPSDGATHLKVLYSYNKLALNKNKKVARHIPQTAEKVIDAPDLVDDFYLNVLDWSVNNTLAIGLKNQVYFYQADCGTFSSITPASADSYVTSISWHAGGQHVAIGTSENVVQLWDIECRKKIRTLQGHCGRVSSLSWNNGILTSGGKDGFIINHDVSRPQAIVSSFIGHEKEVCGLKWSSNKTQLASGGNDCLVNIYDARQIGAGRQVLPTFTFTEHVAAVKALSWAPFQTDLLATGGGTADRSIKFWNTTSGALLDSIDTESQVCSLLWSQNSRELVSSHGFSRNQICVWKYPTLAKIAELTGHTSRVLYTALSPDGRTVASASADESLRFWKVFDSVAESKNCLKISTQTVQKTSGLARSLNIR